MVGFGGVLIVLAVLGLYGANVWVLMPALFGVGTTMMIAIPIIQVRLTRTGGLAFLELAEARAIIESCPDLGMLF